MMLIQLKMPKWLGTLVLLTFKFEQIKNCEIFGDFAQLDPDPDPADQN